MVEFKRKQKFHERTQIADAIKLNDEKTFYTKHGDIIVYISFYLTIFVFAFAIFKNFKQRRVAK